MSSLVLSRSVRRFVSLAAASDLPVLLTGETGTGKTSLARCIHQASKRSQGPFVAVNLPALPRDLIQSELFGHEQGAFTGATKKKRGLLITASEGTLLLDEVAEAPNDVQVSLLQFLDTRGTRAIGSVNVQFSNVRVIAATNANLGEYVACGKFRADLFYRLAALSHHLPPLRSQPAILVDAVREIVGGASGIDEDALETLKARTWPGNFRELEHVLQRARLLAGGGSIRPEHLDHPVALGRCTMARTRYSWGGSAVEEEGRIRRALSAVGWHRERAAARLGMSRSTLWQRMKLYGITRHGGHRCPAPGTDQDEGQAPGFLDRDHSVHDRECLDSADL